MFGQVASIRIRCAPGLGSFEAVGFDTDSALEAIDDAAHGDVFRTRQRAKFDAEGVGRAVMNHFSLQLQSLFLIDQQHLQLVADFDMGNGQVAHAKTANADISRCTDSDRLT